MHVCAACEGTARCTLVECVSGRWTRSNVVMRGRTCTVWLRKCSTCCVGGKCTHAHLAYMHMHTHGQWCMIMCTGVIGPEGETKWKVDTKCHQMVYWAAGASIRKRRRAHTRLRRGLRRDKGRDLGSPGPEAQQTAATGPPDSLRYHTSLRKEV